MHDRSHFVRAHWIPIALLLLGTLYLAFKPHTNGLVNFAPALAMAFTGALMMPRLFSIQFRIAAPLIMVVIADIARGELFSHWSVWGKYALLLVSAVWGASLSRQTSIPGVQGRMLVCTILMQLMLNTFAWIGLPEYAKTFAGWWQANTIGVPGFIPTWVFWLNALISDQLTSLVLILVFNWEAAVRRLPALPWRRMDQPAEAL